MKNIILIGSGNVATHLGIALYKKGHKITQVYSRNIKNAKKLATKLNSKYSNKLTMLEQNADLVIVSIKDDAIAEVLSNIKCKSIAHTSGSIDLSVFKNQFSNFGVLYPLQTFNKDIELNFTDIPFCIEANTKEFEDELIEIASSLSNNVVKMNSEQRKQLHIAAVFACNFTNHMFSISNNILSKENIDFKILLPLIKKTIAKLDSNKPNDVQTGPAARKDLKVINNHLNLIQQKEIKDLYNAISNNIIKFHE